MAICVLPTAHNFNLQFDDTKQVIGVERELESNQPRLEVDDMVVIHGERDDLG